MNARVGLGVWLAVAAATVWPQNAVGGPAAAGTSVVTPATTASAAQAPAQTVPRLVGDSSAALPPEVRRVIGLDLLLQQLAELREKGDTSSMQVLLLRQQVLERTLRASFEVDNVLGRIDQEASYATEDRYALEQRTQHENTVLNFVTFAASGALGAAGSAMQLTRGLNHAGTAFQAAAGGTALGLSALQIKGFNPKLTVRSPYNMLAVVFDRTPNAESHYPAIVLAYLQSPSRDGHTPLGQALTAAWVRLHRVHDGAKGGGTSMEAAILDRSANEKVSADDLADREAMLRDLHSVIILLRGDLEAGLLAADGPGNAPPRANSP